jgi:hypothetical protein
MGPATAPAVKQAPEIDLLASKINSEATVFSPHIQAAHLARRFQLPPATAAAIAELAFRNGGNAR